MPPEIGFSSFLLLTVALLVGVTWSGFRAARALHLVLVASTLAALALSIAYAKRLGAVYDVHAAGWITPFHLGLAKVTTASYLLPLVTGLVTLRRPAARRWHRRAAFLVLALTLVTTATGAWMLFASPRVG